MSRKSFRLAVLAATVLPLALVAAFLVACCHAPLHDVAHGVVPLCHRAAEWLSSGGEHEQEPAGPSEPASRKESARNWTLEVRVAYETPHHSSAGVIDASSPGAAYRSFIAHGALRCDDDVGALLVLNCVFLI